MELKDLTNPPKTCEEALTLWDAGEPVPTISMGGLGKAYEMALQTVAFEMIRGITEEPKLRSLVDSIEEGKPIPDGLADGLHEIADRIDAKDPETEKYALGGLSGAQVGAARNLALIVTRDGYQRIYDDEVRDRLIVIQKTDPVALLIDDYKAKIAEEPDEQMADHYRDRVAELENKA